MTQQIGQYRILSELGAGEFAASPSALERSRKETQLQARLNHANIAQLYTVILLEVVDAALRKRPGPTREYRVP